MQALESTLVEGDPDEFGFALEPPESPRNIGVSGLVRVHARLMQLDWGTIDAIESNWKDGAPQRVITSMLNEEVTLTEVHTAQGRLRSRGEQKLHELGLIMGAIACNNHHHAVTGTRLQADHPDEYEAAYEALAEDELMPRSGIYGLLAELSGSTLGRWFDERHRELELTGDDAFSTMYAITRPHVERLLRTAPTSDWREAGTVARQDAATSLLTGLVDARRFFINYLRNIQQREYGIERFDVVNNKFMPVPLNDDRLLVAGDGPVEQELARIDYGRSQAGWYDLTCGGVPGKILTQSQYVQVGPSEFQLAHMVYEAQVPADYPAGRPKNWLHATQWLREKLPAMERQGLAIAPHTALTDQQQYELDELTAKRDRVSRVVMLPVHMYPRRTFRRMVHQDAQIL